MVKLELTSILFSKKNLDLGYKLHKSCMKICMNLVCCLNFVELSIKVMQLKPQIVFCDLSTIDLSSSNLKLMMENEYFKQTQIIFIGNDSHKNMLDNLGLNKYDFIRENEIESYLFNSLNVIKFNAENTIKSQSRYAEICSSVAQTLSNLGFSPKHTGYSYLREIIINVVENDGVISSLVGEQYPFIAVKFKTTACNIERNIRNAISCAYKKCHHLWNEVFNENILVCEKKPTNREFICLCVDKILNEIQFVELKQKYA